MGDINGCSGKDDEATSLRPSLVLAADAMPTLAWWDFFNFFQPKIDAANTAMPRTTTMIITAGPLSLGASASSLACLLLSGVIRPSAAVVVPPDALPSAVLADVRLNCFPEDSAGENAEPVARDCETCWLARLACALVTFAFSTMPALMDARRVRTRPRRAWRALLLPKSTYATSSFCKPVVLAVYAITLADSSAFSASVRVWMAGPSNTSLRTCWLDETR